MLGYTNKRYYSDYKMLVTGLLYAYKYNLTIQLFTSWFVTIQVNPKSFSFPFLSTTNPTLHTYLNLLLKPRQSQHNFLIVFLVPFFSQCSIFAFTCAATKTQNIVPSDAALLASSLADKQTLHEDEVSGRQ